MESPTGAGRRGVLFLFVIFQGTQNKFSFDRITAWCVGFEVGGLSLLDSMG